MKRATAVGEERVIGGRTMKQVAREKEATVTPTVCGTERLKGKEAILAVLNRIDEEDGFLEQLFSNAEEAIGRHCVLTKEELDALVNGDTQKIEGWLNRLDTSKVKAWLDRLNLKLDPQLAAWLWRR